MFALRSYPQSPVSLTSVFDIVDRSKLTSVASPRRRQARSRAPALTFCVRLFSIFESLDYPKPTTGDHLPLGMGTIAQNRVAPPPPRLRASRR